MYEIIKSENNEVEVKLTVDANTWDSYVEKAYKENKSKFNIQTVKDILWR